VFVRLPRLLRAVTVDVAHVLLSEGHNRVLYRMWCHPEKGLLRKCHPDPFEQHALGIRRCAACKRPL
jgi:hypothetical protein